jgi:ATP-binding cassette subfamily C protein
MFLKIKTAINLLDTRDKRLVIFYALLRSFLGALDLIGIFLMGLLLAQTASLIGGGNSNAKNPTPIEIPFVQNWTISQLALLALAAFIAKSILSTVFMKLMVKTLARAEASIATKLFSKTLNSQTSIITKRSKSDSVFSLTYSVGYAITDLLTVSVTIFSETILLIAIVCAFAFVDLQLTGIIAIYFLLIGFLIQTVVGKQFQKAGTKYADAAVESSLLVEDSLTTYREIKTLKKENFFVKQFELPRKELAEATATVQFLYALPRYIVESALMIGALGLAAISARSGNSIEAAQTLGIFLTGGLRIMASMLPLQNALGASKQLAARAEKFFDLQEDLKNTEFKSQSNDGKVSTSTRLPVGIELNNVGFIYPDSNRSALSDISLRIEPGQLVAFIGPSGAGKSTLADLIIGITDSSNGTIKYFSNSDQSTNAEKYQFGYVPQIPGMVSGTIAENIALGQGPDQIDNSLLNEAIKLAHLETLISNLDDGIKTYLGAHSNALSGGQLQRIGLARSLYVKPNLLVLDEATSALDADSEAAVSQSLNELRGPCTIIVIAHRLSTVQNADKVFVIDEGKIVAEGKFTELAKSNELVARYVELSGLETN